MKFYFLFFIFYITFLFSYSQENVSGRKVISYENIREKDIIWFKKTLRIIDLREEINHTLYLPDEPEGGFNDRMNLIDLLLYSIKKELITAYSAENSYNMFRKKISFTEIKNNGFFTDGEIAKPDSKYYYNEDSKIKRGEINTFQVTELLIMEGWFVYKGSSKMEVRILGICPKRHYYEKDEHKNNLIKKKLFWVYFPNIRQFLAKHQAFNPINSTENKTFDDIFSKRLFNSFILREENIFNNRQINQYTIGLNSVVEEERKKRKMRNMESDLWSN